MSRLKQNRMIDNAIDNLAFIAQNQCSLSETDVKIVNEALESLLKLRRKKGKTYKEIRKAILQVAIHLLNIFCKKS